MNVAAQNALLKVLEEPPPDGYFLLISENEQELLPTIRSRCQMIRAGKLDTATISTALTLDGADSGRASIAASLSNGNFVRARELVDEDLQELQSDVINFMAESARCNPLDLPDTVARVRERLLAADRSYFDFLNLFLRDAALYCAVDEAARERLIFRGLEKRISNVVKAYPDADYETAMHAVDESADYISLGYSADFVLYALAIRIHNALGKRAAAS
jgi:DNA polymerase-3 subunit delta'